MNRVEILPSLLSMDFSCIKKSLEKIPSNVNILHLDIMDGNFVDNITFGPFIVKTIKDCTDKKLDAHLMIADPEKYADEFIKAGIDSLSFHIETAAKPFELIKKIKSNNIKAGLAINPPTDIRTIENYINEIDYVLIMSVNPGFAGQEFIKDVLIKTDFLLNKRDDIIIEIDGGINFDTAKSAVEKGISWLVSGSFLFKQDNIYKAVERMKNGY